MVRALSDCNTIKGYEVKLKLWWARGWGVVVVVGGGGGVYPLGAVVVVLRGVLVFIVRAVNPPPRTL
jgi:hypothetical protein